MNIFKFDLMWLSFYRSSFLKKKKNHQKGNYHIGRLRSWRTIFRPIVSNRDTILSANLATSPLSQHFVPTWEFYCLFRIKGEVGGECPVGKIGILGVFRPREAFKVSNPWQQCHPQTSAKYPLPGSFRYQQIGPISFTPGPSCSKAD